MKSAGALVFSCSLLEPEHPGGFYILAQLAEIARHHSPTNVRLTWRRQTLAGFLRLAAEHHGEQCPGFATAPGRKDRCGT